MNNIHDFTNVRLLNTDILVKLKPWGEVRGYSLFVQEDPDKDANQYFEVISVSPKVTEVKMGDIVLIPWTRVTPPMKVIKNNKIVEVGITDITEVLGVIEI